MPYMPNGHRRGALDVSFGDDPTANPPPPKPIQYAPTLRQQEGPEKKQKKDSSNNNLKRKSYEQLAAQPIKKIRENATFASITTHRLEYTSGHLRGRKVQETRQLLLPGEIRDVTEDAEPEKPKRYLTKFSFYYTIDGGTPFMAPLHYLLQPQNGEKIEYYASGFATAVLDTDEDEGQDGEEDDNNNEGSHVVLAPISYSYNYSHSTDRIFLETKHAWYLLDQPAPRYLGLWKPFYRNLRTAQMIISWVSIHPKGPRSSFETFYVNEKSLYGEPFKKAHITEAVTQLLHALRVQTKDFPDLRACPLVRQLVGTRLSEVEDLDPARRAPQIRPSSNADIRFLQADQQERTHVMPNIATLADGWFPEKLQRIGPKAKPDPNCDTNRGYFAECVARANMLNKLVVYSQKPNGQLHRNFARSVSVGGIQYAIGDVAVIRHPENFPASIDVVAPGTSLNHYFWFGKIVWIQRTGSVHVQWLQHGSEIVLNEFAHPKEFFFGIECDSIPVQSLNGKVTVRFMNKGEGEYLCRFKYTKDAAFVSLGPNDLAIPHNELEDNNPLNSCPSCHEQWKEAQAQVTQSEGEHAANGLTEATAITRKGSTYHVKDFVLWRNEEGDKGPAKIGQIICLQKQHRGDETGSPWVVEVLPFGRIRDVRHLPATEMKDERHLYIPRDMRETKKIPSNLLIRVVMVFAYESVEEGDLRLLISHSAYTFFVKYYFPTLNAEWDDRRENVDPHQFGICNPCASGHLKSVEDLKSAMKNTDPLPALDLFGGIGAFGCGMAAGSRIMKVTHAIEISPSAANTYKKSYPEIKVHNQCVNRVLKYWHQYWKNGPEDRPSPLEQLSPINGNNVPTPPKQGEIKVVVAGFPCQSHSTLNMYKSESDRKSNLILPTLSFIELINPDYCFFENVPGFLQYNLNVTQATQYKVEGGLVRGGLKLVLRALIDMDYQVRFGLLQAAHYGTPQDRERFFLCAAKRGRQLPSLPQPTHNFPDSRKLAIKDIFGLPKSLGREITPIDTSVGIAPHSFVTIREAIGDLPAFDYKHPGSPEPAAYQEKRIGRQKQGIPAKKCFPSIPCGFENAQHYKDHPMTRFQLEARRQSRRCKQQFTPSHDDYKVRMILGVPLKPKADYMDWDQPYRLFMSSNPVSANARAGFRKGMFGRLDANGVFRTIVTNVGPTAKQSYVLHPWYQRMVTVRELARAQGLPDSYEFISEKGLITTMHRQIGNAVPWQMAEALGRELQVAYMKNLENAEDGNDMDMDMD